MIQISKKFEDFNRIPDFNRSLMDFNRLFSKATWKNFKTNLILEVWWIRFLSKATWKDFKTNKEIWNDLKFLSLNRERMNCNENESPI